MYEMIKPKLEDNSVKEVFSRPFSDQTHKKRVNIGQDQWYVVGVTNKHR